MLPHQETELCVEELRTALAAHSITLPSLDIDLPTFASTYAEPPLVSLGRCPVDIARALIAVLRKAAEG